MSMTMPLLLLALGGSAFQSSQDLPDLPHYIAHGHQPTKWVMLGTGAERKVSAALQEKQISYIELPWLLIPREALKSLSEQAESKSDSIVGFLVDSAAYNSIKTVVGRTPGLIPRLRLTTHPQVIFPGPTDEDLEVNFVKKRRLLEDALLLAKSFKRFDFFETYPDPSSAGRTVFNPAEDRLRKSLIYCSVNAGVARISSDSWELSCWDFGSTVTEEYSKGYAWLKYLPKDLKSKHHNVWPDHKKRSIVYRHLSGNWYVYSRFIPR